MRWIVRKDQSEYMKKRQKQNRSRLVPAENWAAQQLQTTGRRWTRQAIWGCRLFDFWCAPLGIAVEIDGLTHEKDYDNTRDRYNFFRSGIVVLRVKNYDDEGMRLALQEIALACDWKTRKDWLRQEFGVRPEEPFSRVAVKAGIAKAHGRWKPPILKEDLCQT